MISSLEAIIKKSKVYTLEELLGSIRHIQRLDTAYWGFLGVWTTFDIFQNIQILYLRYDVLTSSGYGALSFIPLWSLYKKCEECKYDKISYDKAYNDMQHQIKRFQAPLEDIKGKSINTQCASNTLDYLAQKLDVENVSSEFQTHAQTKLKTDTLQEKLNAKISEKAKLRAKFKTKFFEKIDELEGVESTTKTKRPHPRSNTKNDRVPSASKGSCLKNNEDKVVKIFLWCFNSGCSKHMTGNLKLLINFVWKFMGIVCFGDDHVITFLGYNYLQWGNILITCVYFVEGLGQNLFSDGKFYDSNLEVAFRRNTCIVKNLDGVDLLKGNRSTNLYTINLYEMTSGSLVCPMARATSTKSWLWHQRLSYLNFDTINTLGKDNLITCLLKFKYSKDHICPSCEPMRVESINGKMYILVIVDDYSRYTWVPFLRSKDEAPKVIIKFLKQIQVLLQAPVIIVSDNKIEFTHKELKAYFEDVAIFHQTSSVRTPKQNGVVERRNWTLVEATRMMLIFSCASLFLWVEAVYTVCYTQNQSLIHKRFNKTPYELINDRKPDISFLHVYVALCYLKNDHEDIGKLGAKGDISFFISYSTTSCAYKVYNRRTKKVMETMHVTFNELLAMAFEQSSSKLDLQGMTSGHISSGLDLTYALSTITSQKPTKRDLELLFEASTMELRNVKVAMTDAGWIEAMQEKLLQFKRLDVSDLYVVSIKEDTTYLSMHFTRNQDELKSNTSYPEASICHIEDYLKILEDIKREEHSGYEIAEVMGKTIEEYMCKTRGDYGSGVARLKIDDKPHFKLKGQFLKELRDNTFSGTDHKDVNEHIKKVLEIVNLFYIPEITQDQIMLRDFPMSLTGAMSRWLRNEPSGSVIT
ncbi:retrovirus-related pol polyprotein from transposon TNT 1-94 [Tanacetum coccineum]